MVSFFFFFFFFFSFSMRTDLLTQMQQRSLSYCPIAGGEESTALEIFNALVLSLETDS